MNRSPLWCSSAPSALARLRPSPATVVPAADDVRLVVPGADFADAPTDAPAVDDAPLSVLGAAAADPATAPPAVDDAPPVVLGVADAYAA